MRRTPRAAISLGLSLAMALGGLPAQALADAIEDGDVVQESVTPVSDDSPIIEVPPVEAAEAESIDANEAPIEKGLVAQDETEPQEVVSAEDDSSPRAPPRPPSGSRPRVTPMMPRRRSLPSNRSRSTAPRSSGVPTTPCRTPPLVECVILVIEEAPSA